MADEGDREGGVAEKGWLLAFLDCGAVVMARHLHRRDHEEGEDPCP